MALYKLTMNRFLAYSFARSDKSDEIAKEKKII